MIRFYSTNQQTEKFSLEQAVLCGLAPDGGLFMPDRITSMNPKFFDSLFSLSLTEIALEVGKQFLQDAISARDLQTIIRESITFDAPLVYLSEDVYSLELFHGPTLSFKDFGARFMAQLLAFFNRNEDRELHILAATSGDTGSAVAHGFLNVPGIKVWILYPQGQVSEIQEKQLTTIGHNVTALEIEGTFDDCQSMVKQAFNDRDLCKKIQLTSANSINIARLIPQTFYYFYAYAQLQKRDHPVVFSVPSGNFGNLTAGLFAKKMGLPVARFIAATNINDSVPRFLHTGIFKPHSSKQTLSNAMDVGNPSNFARIRNLYDDHLNEIRQDLIGISITDEKTKEAIYEIDKDYSYLADPHGAVAYLGLKYYQKQFGKTHGIFLETAHPAKFLEVVEPVVQRKIEIPERLRAVLDKKKETILLPCQYQSLRDLLYTQAT